MVSLDQLLLAMPPDGQWMPGTGRYGILLTELLDAGTSLIEENILAESDVELGPWLVRLTAEGIAKRAGV